MTIKELKNYVSKLPDELNDFDVVKGELQFDSKDRSVTMVNNVVITIHVDMQNKELQLFHQTQEEIKNLVVNEKLF